ncbi:MAG TPA: protein-disulfide reductase DsbD [Burkholderiales bacterium]|nr:protein-disulfide reductase DsbD [Burkholderiales bacterium]
MDRLGDAALKRLLLLLVVLVAARAVAADDLLEPEKAFRFSARMVAGPAVDVRFAIAPGYYLYRDRLRFAVEGNPRVALGAPEFPPALAHKDEFFGEMPIYRQQVSIRLPVRGEGPFELKVTSQGCADSGVCYVPMDSRARLQAAALDAPSLTPGSAAPPAEPRLSIYASDLDIARLLEGNFALALGGFLVLGVLLAFTPCVLPMLPILSGIIAGEGKNLNKSRALGLSVTYVLSMAATYAAAGVAAAYAGSLIAAYLQNVWVLGAFAALFVVLALSMFGFYEFRLPGFLHHRLHETHGRLRGGRIASVAAMGVLSAVIVSPCVSAPLAGTLLQISRTGDVVLGGSALFALALGMGLPLIVLGVSEGALLPRAGAWMVGVRKFFGVLLLGVALWILSPLLAPAAEMAAWAVLLVGSAMFLRALDPLPASASGWWRAWKALGILALVAGVALLVGALAGSRDPLRPLAGLMGAGAPAQGATPWQRVRSLAELEQALRAGGRPAMLDFYADWCVSCKEMEKFTFSDPRVRGELDRMLLLQADVTAGNDADRQLLKRFSLFGPPGIIFFDAAGREVPGLRVIGYQPPERFLRTLAAARH